MSDETRQAADDDADWREDIARALRAYHEDTTQDGVFEHAVEWLDALLGDVAALTARVEQLTKERDIDHSNAVTVSQMLVAQGDELAAARTLGYARGLEAAIDAAHDHVCSVGYGLCDCQGEIVKAVSALKGQADPSPTTEGDR